MATAPPKDDGTLFSISDAAQFYQIEGSKTIYAVFTIPGSKPPIRIAYAIPSMDDWKSMFGPDVKPKVDVTLTREQWKSQGIMNFGTTTELANMDDDPFSTWVQTMKTQAAVQPWIMERDYQALVAMATLEGRPLTEAEIQGTKWWKSHSVEQREWMKLYHGDRKTANARLADNRIKTLQSLKDAGIQNPSTALLNFMSDQVTMGEWTVAKFQQQVLAVSDPFSGIAIDAKLRPLMKPNQGTTRAGEVDVMEMAREWLGPVHGLMQTKDLQRWAGRIRNDPDAQTEFLAFLKKQRMAVLPEYTDNTLTYEDIAQPWRAFASNVWGETVNEKEPIFMKMLKQNDHDLNGTMLRKEGFKRNIGKVVQDAQSELLGAGGGAVRRVYGI